jgi:sugar transferase EpsL
VAVIALLALSPLLALIALAIRCSMGGPVLFRQVRTGLNESLFTCFKFRTMREEPGADGSQRSESARLTKLGMFLRRTSLDELPQFWNILRGDMSLVGPRPLLEQYLPYYTAEERRRHLTRPGLTGWAQIHGRNYLSFEERFQMDVWYVDHLTWRLDAQIVLATIWLVITGKDVALYPEQCGTLNDERKSRVHSN